jgi:hypothetical protein
MSEAMIFFFCEMNKKEKEKKTEERKSRQPQ